MLNPTNWIANPTPGKRRIYLGKRIFFQNLTSTKTTKMLYLEACWVIPFIPFIPDTFTQICTEFKTGMVLFLEHSTWESKFSKQLTKIIWTSNDSRWNHQFHRYLYQVSVVSSAVNVSRINERYEKRDIWGRLLFKPKQVSSLLKWLEKAGTELFKTV